MCSGEKTVAPRSPSKVDSTLLDGEGGISLASMHSLYQVYLSYAPRISSHWYGICTRWDIGIAEVLVWILLRAR